MRHKKLLIFFLVLGLAIFTVLIVKAQLDQTQSFPAHVSVGEQTTNNSSSMYPLKVTWTDGTPVGLIDFGKLAVNSEGQPCITCPYHT